MKYLESVAEVNLSLNEVALNVTNTVNKVGHILNSTNKHNLFNKKPCCDKECQNFKIFLNNIN